MKKTYETTTYVICHGANNALHFSKVNPGTTLHSGQPNIEEFDNEEAWKARVTELGGVFEPSPSQPRTPQTPEQRAALREERHTARQLKLEQRVAQRASTPKPQKVKLSREQRTEKAAQLRAQRDERRGVQRPAQLRRPTPTPEVTPVSNPQPKATKSKSSKKPKS